MSTWKEHKKRLLKNKNFRDSYNNLEPEYQIASEIIKARLSMNMTQAELAEKAGISRIVITRLESGVGNPTIGTIHRVAEILSKKLRLV